MSRKKAKSDDALFFQHKTTLNRTYVVLEIANTVCRKRVFSKMNEEKELPSSSYADDTSKENIQPQIAFIPSILDAIHGESGSGSGSTSVGDGVVQDTTYNDGADGVGG